VPRRQKIPAKLRSGEMKERKREKDGKQCKNKVTAYRIPKSRIGSNKRNFLREKERVRERERERERPFSVVVVVAVV